MLDQIVEQRIPFGLLLLARTDRYVQSHDDHTHQTALEFVPQKLGCVAGHGLGSARKGEIGKRRL